MTINPTVRATYAHEHREDRVDELDLEYTRVKEGILLGCDEPRRDGEVVCVTEATSHLAATEANDARLFQASSTPN